MLDTDTKRRIDTARDILVGKVPDPKSQVEQITIALIYKFMDDMDAESEELGGERSFFTGKFAKYGWAKLMDRSLGGHVMLGLYGEGISKMPENPGIPALFRDIFKNAYLPYRDPETLRAFLKIINEFSYDHSERLGDAFEYLLSVLGSQGDAGQFRTPRHIIDFMVAVLDPKKDETVLDPACGTAGFLISSYKHIVRQNTDKKGNVTLTPDDKARLARNFKGYDISPDMVRLSLVNLYLHGFTEPHIYEYDTLTSEERWNEFADVILANPPFMSPKGGIKPHKRFSIQAKRSEVLFVDYMAEHLAPKGRAAIIVPEGIIFQSQTAYKELRKMLVENSLVAVVSLPAGCFNPYSGVKTSILILDKTLARQSDTIAFFKVENDGFGLGAQRRAIDGEELTGVKAELAAYLQALRSGASIEALLGVTSTAQIVPKAKLAANGDYNLSGERYRENGVKAHIFPLVGIGNVCTINPGKSQLAELKQNTRVSFVPMADINENQIVFQAVEEKMLSEVATSYTYFEDNDVLLAKVTPCFENGKAGIARGLKNGIGFGSSEFYVLRSNGEVLPEWIYFCVMHPLFRDSAVAQMTGTGGLQRVPRNYVENFQIPLPPLEVQKEIVAEIEGYQKIINGSRAVLDHYRPHIPINPEWPIVELGEIIDELESGVSVNSTSTPTNPGELGILKTSCVTRGVFQPEEHKTVVPEELTRVRCPVRGNTIIISRMNTEALVGANAYVDKEYPNLFLPDRLWQTVISRPDVEVRYVQTVLASDSCRSRISTVCGGTSGSMKNITKPQLLSITIPLPPIDTQQSIMAEIEAELALVAANRELIIRFEQKIQTTLARIWGEDSEAAAVDYGSSPPQLAAKNVANKLATLKRQQAAAVQVAPELVPSPKKERPETKTTTPPEPTEPSRPTHPDELEKSDLMSLLRDVLTEHGPCDRDTVIKQAATSLGYRRVREGLSETVSNAIRTAVRRQVLVNGGSTYNVNRAGIADFDMDFLKTQFLAAVSEQGRVWTDRDDAIRAFARWFGFRRTGSVIDETARKLISRLVRAGRLEAAGDSIRRK